MWTGCSADDNGHEKTLTTATDASARPQAKTLDAGGKFDAGGRFDAGPLASDGAITRDEAGRTMRHGAFDPRYPTCNAPSCVPLNERCSSDSDCCQPGGWADHYLCIGNYCGFLVGGSDDPVWHDPIPFCTGDSGTHSP